MHMENPMLRSVFINLITSFHCLTRGNWRSDYEFERNPKEIEFYINDTLSSGAFHSQDRMESNAYIMALPPRCINRDTIDNISNTLDGNLKNRAANDLKVCPPHLFQNNDCIRKERIRYEEAQKASPIDDKDCSTYHF